MATGNTNYSTLVTTTLQDHGKKIFDAVSTNNAFYWMLQKNGNIKVRAGGRTFTHPIIYGTNSSFQMYSKLETIALPVTDIITRAEYPIKVAAGSIVLGTIDLAMNAGNREKLLDMAEEKKLEAEISMTELMGDQVFASGANAKDFDGLNFLCNLSPSTQTDVGGIDPSATGNEYWQNQVDTTGTGTFNTDSAGLLLMNSMLNSCTFGRQGPKAIFTTKTVYGLYEIGLTSNIRYARTDLADAGFRHLQYTTMPVLFDDNATTAYMYFVDTDSLWLQVLAQANMKVTQFQLKIDQLASSSLMYLAGNLTTGSRRTQGLLTALTA
jgi:hypothetical protein